MFQANAVAEIDRNRVSELVSFRRIATQSLLAYESLRLTLSLRSPKKIRSAGSNVMKPRELFHCETLRLVRANGNALLGLLCLRHDCESLWRC